MYEKYKWSYIHQAVSHTERAHLKTALLRNLSAQVIFFLFTSHNLSPSDASSAQEKEKKKRKTHRRALIKALLPARHRPQSALSSTHPHRQIQHFHPTTSRINHASGIVHYLYNDAALSARFVKASHHSAHLAREAAYRLRASPGEWEG